MIEGVLHQGLQGDLGDPVGIKFRGDIYLIVQDILVADLLDLQIAAGMAQLFLDGNVVLSFIKAGPEETGQGSDQADDLVFLFRFRQPDDGVQGIVEEMGIDLGLEQLQLRPAQVFLFSGDLGDQLLELVDHFIDVLAQFPDLRAVFDMCADIQIAVGDLPGDPGNLVDRPGDGPGNHRRGNDRDDQQNKGADAGDPDKGDIESAQLPHLLLHMADLIEDIFVEGLLDQGGHDLHVVLPDHHILFIPAACLQVQGNAVNIALQVVQIFVNAGDPVQVVARIRQALQLLHDPVGFRQQLLQLRLLQGLVLHDHQIGLIVKVFLEFQGELTGHAGRLQQALIAHVLGVHAKDRQDQQDHQRHQDDHVGDPDLEGQGGIPVHVSQSLQHRLSSLPQFIACLALSVLLSVRGRRHA